MVFNLRWGFISTGGIVERMIKDLLLPPSDRDVSDVQHEIVAVASRSKEKADKFVAAHLPKEMRAKAFGSYEELYSSPDVDVVYIGTPHPQHYQNVKEALLHSKNVLCEKPFVLTSAQSDELFDLAKKNGCFLMEAVWTRYQPVVAAAQKVVFGGEIGAIKRVDSRFDKDFGDLDHSHRMLNPISAGGSFYDLGPYALLWSTLFLYQHPGNAREFPKEIKSVMRVDKRTGVDASMSWIMLYEELGATATCSVALDTPTPDSCIVVTGTLGTLTLHGASPYPSSFTVHLFANPQSTISTLSSPSSTTSSYPIKSGRGMHWQGDAVARAIRDGKLEEEKCSWRETRLAQFVFDEVRVGSGLDGIFKAEGVEGI